MYILVGVVIRVTKYQCVLCSKVFVIFVKSFCFHRNIDFIAYIFLLNNYACTYSRIILIKLINLCFVDCG
jgi:hypothetical protein